MRGGPLCRPRNHGSAEERSGAPLEKGGGRGGGVVPRASLSPSFGGRSVIWMLGPHASVSSVAVHEEARLALAPATPALGVRSGRPPCKRAAASVCAAGGPHVPGTHVRHVCLHDHRLAAQLVHLVGHLLRLILRSNVVDRHLSIGGGGGRGACKARPDLKLERWSSAANAAGKGREARELGPTGIWYLPPWPLHSARLAAGLGKRQRHRLADSAAGLNGWEG